MIKKQLIDNAKKTELFLKKYIKKQKKTNLLKAMKYGTLSGGKKIRSSVILNTGKLFNLNTKKLINICGAVECIHSYSLIHDDLPCMDNDKVRRGKPSTHVKFGEGVVLQFEGSGERAKVQINFDVGAKWLMASVANLEVVSS